MTIGLIVGAITFSGSIVAFTKLQGLVGGSPVIFWGQHWLNLLLGGLIVAGASYFCVSQSKEVFWIVTALAFLIGIMIIIPIGGADMPTAAPKWLGHSVVSLGMAERRVLSNESVIYQCYTGWLRCRPL